MPNDTLSLDINIQQYLQHVLIELLLAIYLDRHDDVELIFVVVENYNPALVHSMLSNWNFTVLKTSQISHTKWIYLVKIQLKNNLQT